MTKSPTVPRVSPTKSTHMVRYRKRFDAPGMFAPLFDGQTGRYFLGLLVSAVGLDHLIGPSHYLAQNIAVNLVHVLDVQAGFTSFMWAQLSE